MTIKELIAKLEDCNMGTCDGCIFRLMCYDEGLDC